MRLHHTVCTAALISSLFGLSVGLGPARGVAAPVTSARRSAVVEVVEKVRGAVVNIHSERTAMGPANEDLFALSPSQNRINGMGTGIVLDPRGYIVTNQHVVEDVNVIRVRLADGTAHTARVLARDKDADLAILKIETSKPLPTIPLGTASDLMIGETVIAVGNAYGYEHTVTMGIVSAIKRDVTLNKDIAYKALIQTDASINPGNSGGPLLNVNGELVGVNVAIRAGAQGIAFAISADTMIRVAADMLSIRKRNGTWHGIIARDRVDTEQEPVMRTLLVERVESGSPAAHAGLQTGDVLAKVGDLRVASSLDLERALLDKNAGDHVPLVIRRKGGEQGFDLLLETAERGGVSLPELVWRKLGIRLRPVKAETVIRVNQQLHGGMAVTELDPQAAAAKAGIQAGDILVGLHQWETLTLDNVAFVLTHPDLASFNPICFYIVRAGQVRRGWLPQID